jgi:hypothetical protein
MAVQTLDILLPKLKSLGSVPDNDGRYTDTVLTQLLDSNITKYITPLLYTLAQEYFIVEQTVSLTNSDSTVRFNNRIVPLSPRAIARSLREVKWASGTSIVSCARKGLDNEYWGYTGFSPIMFELMGEGIRYSTNNSTASISGSFVFDFGLKPSTLVNTKVSAALLQVQYDVTNSKTYLTCDTTTASDFSTNTEVLVDITGAQGSVVTAWDRMVYLAGTDYFGSGYKTFINEKDMVWNDFDTRQTLGFRILNTTGTNVIKVASTSASDTNQIVIAGFDAAGNAVNSTITLTGTTPVTVPSTIRFINQVYMTSATVGNVVLQDSQGSPSRKAKIPTGCLNCYVGQVLPYASGDLYVNMAGQSYFPTLPPEAIELLLLKTAFDVLSLQGDAEAAMTLQANQLKPCHDYVVKALSQRSIGEPETVFIDRGVTHFCSPRPMRW